MTLDFGSPLDFLWALLPEVVLTTVALLILLADVWQRGSRPGSGGRWMGPAAIAGVVAAALANAWLSGVDAPARTAMIAVDSFRIVANFLILGATGLAVLLGMDWVRREGLDIGEFYFLILTAAVGMMLLGGSRDLIVVFVALELMSLSVYVLTGLNRKDPRSAEGGLKYFLLGAFASAFLLYGIALLFGATGSTNLALVAAEVARGAAEGNLLLLAGVGMLLIGFAFKVSAVPFHMWTPDAYEGAPTPVTGFMATGVKAAGFLALLRIVTVELSAAEAFWHGTLWWLAILTMIVPNLIALAQDSVKRMLAYSSIAHAGYLLVGVVAGGAVGRGAILFYLAAYVPMTLGAFAIVYAVAGKADRRGALADYRGLGWRSPLLGVLFTVFLLSLAGVPPTGGFVGKLYLLRAAVDSDQIALALTLVVASFVSYYYYLRVIWKMYFDEHPEGAPLPAPQGLGYRAGALASAAVVLLLGLWPAGVVRVAERAGEELTPRTVAPLEEPVTPVPTSTSPATRASSE